MAQYLNKYVGTYRVKAHYDIALNDYPRDDLGNIDRSFDDLYIDCSIGNQIYHYGGQTLVAYIPSVGRGHNILKKLYQIHINEDVGKFETTNENSSTFDYDSMYAKLIENKVIISIIETSQEIEFKFKTKQLEPIAELLKAKTSGSKIRPLSEKNLQWMKYEIPIEDDQRFKKLIEDIHLSKINKLYSNFSDKYKIDLNAARKKAKLKNKEYIHSLGMWNKFLDFIKLESKSM